MKKAVLIAIIVVGLLVSAGIILFSNKELVGDMPPIPKVTTGVMEVPIELGSYTWKSIVDKDFDFEQFIKKNNPVPVSPGAEITVDFSNYKSKPKDMSFGYINKAENGWLSLKVAYSAKNGIITIPNDAGKGIAIISLTATWGSSTEAKYLIPIEIKPFEKIIGEAEVKTVTKEQLEKITPKLTYQEIVEILGYGKDVGSGLYILEYEYNGQQFTLNFVSYEGLITEDDYKEIQNLIAK